MAFQTNTQSALNNVAALVGLTQEKDDSWKSQGFLNLYIPTKSGSRRKVGTIFLKESRATDKQLLDAFKRDPEATMKKLMSVMELEFNTAEGSEDLLDL